MSKYNLTKYEQETIILYNNEETFAEVYSCNKAMINKLDKLCAKFPETFKKTAQDECSKTYVFPKRLVTIRAPKVLSLEQKEKLKQNTFKSKTT